ncbi:Imidazoleglycerol-phosphate dehydratase [Hibiscus syriacus]|uniref:imidazoleglycerol-phosphate dehydratase n=1 Tax=Hibiscus syriacus TaxID=106335 RepID=A0A6A2Y906_HIBSY|nr:Imidazoleglycerol-phosphate dehydratase [Hibiscus syriacus]
MELSISSRLLNTSSSNAAATTLLKSKPRFRHRHTSIPLIPLQHSLSPLTLKEMSNNNSQSTLSCSSLPQSNASPAPISASTASGRIGEVERVTKETNVWVKINLDGTGVANSTTSIPFLDHMLDQLASHGLFDVHVKATGDIHIDDHHTNEDVALALGTALLQSLGDRKGINRFGDFSAPLDEALVHVSLDLSGRPHLSYDLNIPTARVGAYDTQLVEHFFQSLVKYFWHDTTHTAACRKKFTSYYRGNL